jgi:hypothetical protein
MEVVERGVLFQSITGKLSHFGSIVYFQLASDHFDLMDYFDQIDI